MSKTISIANQKGGVGKTTTTLSLGVALAQKGKKVLLIDADPQGNLTTCLGIENEDYKYSISDLMNSVMIGKEFNANEVILHTKENVDLIPANIELSATEMNLGNAMCREFVLNNSIRNIKENYDYILIDCMPSLGLIPINCLSASDEIIIPVQSHFLAVKGMEDLFNTINKIKANINSNLKIKGILITLVDRRTNLSKDIREQLEETYGKYFKIYKTEIPNAIKVAESTIRGKSIFEYDKSGTVANAYKDLAKEVLEDGRTKKRHEIELGR